MFLFYTNLIFEERVVQCVKYVIPLNESVDAIIDGTFIPQSLGYN
jgi:hypothetical protein